VITETDDIYISLSQGVTLQRNLYHKVKVVCKGLTEIQQTVVLWKGGDSNEDQVKVCDMEFWIKHAVLLPLENAY
jgi:ureidoglycolate hydrolase